MILTDAHTHIYPCFDLDILVDAAFGNVAQAISDHGADKSGVLFLTDTAQTGSFVRLHDEAAQPQPSSGSPWRVFSTGERTSVGFEHQHYPDIRLFGIAGFQSVTSERLEVLCVGSAQRPVEGAPLDVTIRNILDSGGLAILPWGVGKWLGKRYQVLHQYIRTCGETPLLFVGDNGNRPRMWPLPKLFSQAYPTNPRVLSGSDPLPISGEERRTGSFGSLVHADFDESHPAESIMSGLANEQTLITPFGLLQSPFTFIRQQVSLRLC